MTRTATTANALLGLLALRPEWTTWELTTQLRRNMRFFWPRSESRILAELKRLHAEGLVRARKESIGRRPRTIYAITAKGRRRLDVWLETPPRATALESEPLLRVLLGDLGTEDQLRQAIDQIEQDALDVIAVGRTVAAEYDAGTAPFQDHVHVRAFVFDFLTTYATGMLEWVARTRATVDRWPQLDDAARAEEAVRQVTKRAKTLPRA